MSARATTGSLGSPRFLTPADAAEILATSVAQIMALIRRKEIRAIQIGGRGQWRIEVTELEAYIQRKYAEADAASPQHVEE